jgi:hypothetical protein
MRRRLAAIVALVVGAATVVLAVAAKGPARRPVRVAPPQGCVAWMNGTVRPALPVSRVPKRQGLRFARASGRIRSSAASISLRAPPAFLLPRCHPLRAMCGPDGALSLVIYDEIGGSSGHGAHRERSVQREPARMSRA